MVSTFHRVEAGQGAAEAAPTGCLFGQAPRTSCPAPIR